MISHPTIVFPGTNILPEIPMYAFKLYGNDFLLLLTTVCWYFTVQGKQSIVSRKDSLNSLNYYVIVGDWWRNQQINSETFCKWIHSLSWRSTIKYENARWLIWEQMNYFGIKNWIFIAWFTIECSSLTFLKTSREHPILPKHSSETGCWAYATIIGSIRFILIGSKYQSIRSKLKRIVSKASVIPWPISHAMNTASIPKNPLIIGSSAVITLPWCN